MFKRPMFKRFLNRPLWTPVVGVVGGVVVVFGGVTVVQGALTLFTRHTKLVPLSTTDAIFNHASYKKFNPNNNPTTHDLVVKKVPFSKIKPELLEDQAKLTERFCAGIWGGAGYWIQRLYMQRKYRGPETSSQLWDIPELKSSTYDVGTQITDHFEVVSKTPESIVVRCGGSPRIKEVRPGEGLFEMFTRLNEKERVVEFGLKSAFFQGAGKSESGEPPMPPDMQELHILYAKLWMETAVRNVTVNSIRELLP